MTLNRNQSPHGWWIASYVLRFVWNGEPEPARGDTAVVWENTMVLQATDRDAAFEKAVKLASDPSKSEPLVDESDPARSGRWMYEGLTNLLPIYDELRDGTEVLWVEHEVPMRELQEWIKGKRDLEVFDDTPMSEDDR
jgi:hypothetical protein